MGGATTSAAVYGRRQALIGFGMASRMWDAMMLPARAAARLTADGKLLVSSATAGFCLRHMKEALLLHQQCRYFWKDIGNYVYWVDSGYARQPEWSK